MISVIIPVYNVEKYIIRCLESVKQQSYKDYEVILVDDCGQDNSIGLAKDYLEKNFPANSHIITHDCNKGLSAARNTGILAATGEFIYFLDSDDAITNDCLSLLYSYNRLRHGKIPVRTREKYFPQVSHKSSCRQQSTHSVIY